jgi:DNA invertase Pin-like site-specific DNA recombinase
MEKIKKTAILYIRTSTTDQKNSIELQEKQLTDYCNEKKLRIMSKYIDFGISGKNTFERIEFTKMMNSIIDSENAPSEIILCTKLDRFARSMLDLSVNIEILTKKCMKLCTLTQTFETCTPIGKLTLNMLGSFAEFERDLINERTREGYQAAKAKGVICNRPKKDIPQKKVLDYLDKGLSASAISKILGTTTGTIKNRLNEWGYYYDGFEWKQK